MPEGMPLARFSGRRIRPTGRGVTRYSAPYWSETMSRPWGSVHMLTHDPSDFAGTEYSNSTLNPLRVFIVAGSVAGGSFGWVAADARPVPGVELELVGPGGEVVARAMTEYDGFFLFERVPYGRYRLKMASSSEQVLGPAGELASGIELGPDKPVQRVGTIRLRERTVVAQARGPPSGGSP